MDLKEEEILDDRISDHWYYKAKTDALLKTIKGINATKILDVGAGSGYFSQQILDRTSVNEAVCVDPNYQSDRQDFASGKSLRFQREITSADADLVLMMDVIEHVEDDRALISRYLDLCRSGTYFLITVPAFMWLWSGHDVFLEHYRRYSLPQLEQVLSSAGLDVLRSHYFFGTVLPGVATVRALNKMFGKTAGSDLKQEGAVLNGFLYCISRAETKIMKLNRFGGTSVFALAVKP